jgi:hypothetical protein
MVKSSRISAAALAFLATLILAPSHLLAQTGGLRGQVTDPSDAASQGASVVVTSATGEVHVATSGPDGRYSLSGLAPGSYKVSAMSEGFAVFEKESVEIRSGRPATLDIRLDLMVIKEEVSVETSPADRLSLDSSSNVGAIVLKGQDLDALSDNPEDLESDLQALAGPAAGPSGGEIYIDGFTGGRLPPKSSIREIRINQNPFSAEFHRLGFGRIEIFTKPGTDTLHGEAFFNFGDAVFNSRNPFAPTRPPYQTKTFGGNLSGSLTKKSSFFVDVERRGVEETSVISALTLDPSFEVVPFSDAVLNPTMRTTVGPRFDYQLSTNHTLTTRYNYTRISRENEGIGEFSLASRAFDYEENEHEIQVSETAVLGPTAINETRFRYRWRRDGRTAHTAEPGISVLGAFNGGGSGVGLSFGKDEQVELHNYTTLTRGSHLLKFGLRLRGEFESDHSEQNYNGTFTFTSLEAYRITLEGLENGLTMEEIRAAGGGPSQFSITGGNPLASVSQYDLGLFIQDDWRVRQNFTLNLGLRYETQNNIRNRMDLAPRFGFAWGVRGAGGRTSTVVRGGFGIFFDRVGEELVLQARRLNGVNQLQYLVPFPDFFPDVPSIETLQANQLPSAIRQLDVNVQAPYVAQSALSLEQQFPKNISVSMTFAHSRGLNALRSRNINAPLPGTWDPEDPDSAVRPFGDVGDVYLYESSGRYSQRQIITRVNARVNPKLNVFGFYVYNKAESNTDGASDFPSNQYDLASEWGRAGFDIRHRAFVGGTLESPLGLRFSPFIRMIGGRPFDITTGRDYNGDSLFNDRPTFATDMTRPSVVTTPYGAFDTDPLPGQPLIPRNFGEGPGQFSINLRISRTFGFGGGESSSTQAASSGPGGSGTFVGLGGPPRGRRGGGGGPGRWGDASTGKRYNLTISVFARNLLNNVNLAPPVGNLSSPLFGTSNALAGGWGPWGSTTANRRIEMQARFTF